MIREIKKLIYSESLKKSFFTISEASVNLLFIIISLPIFLKILGVEKYGIYVLIQSFSAIVGMFNLGGNFTVTKFISKYRGQNQLDNIKSFSSSIFLFQLALSFLFIIILLPFIDVIILKYFNTVNSSIFKEVLVYAIPIFLIDLFEQNFNGIHKGYERFDRALKITLLHKILKYSIQILVILILKNLVDLYKYSLLFSLCFFIFHCILSKKWYAEIYFFTKSSFKVIKNFFEFSLWVWLNSIAALFTSQIDKWLVAAFYDLSSLAYYSIGLSVYNQLHSLTSSSVSWLFPKISFSGITSKIIANFNKSNLILFSISLFVTLFLLVFGDFIFLKWLGGEEYFKAERFIKLFISLLPVLSTTIIPYYYLLGLGKIKSIFLLTVMNFVILTTVFYFLTAYEDLYIIISSFLLSHIIITYFYQHKIQKELSTKKTKNNYIILSVASLISIGLFYINLVS